MPTPAERRALVFLTGLVVLGTGARMWNATAHASTPSVAAREALSRQLAAVDSVRAKGTKGRGGQGGGAQGRSSRNSGAPTRGRGDEREIVSGGSRSSTGRRGLTERGDVVMRRQTVVGATVGGSASGVLTPGGVPVVSDGATPGGYPVDLDRASAAEIERLPRIGPVLARRIVADRDSLGPFGSLTELQRVKGVGPAMAKNLAPYVTFSLRPRHSPVLEQGSAGSPPRRRRRPP